MSQDAPDYGGRWPQINEPAFDPNDDWRNVSKPFREKLLADTVEGFGHTLNMGMEVHGPRFAGDPVRHAKEETFDLLFYIGVMEQWIECLERENDELAKQLGRNAEAKTKEVPND